MIRYKSTSSKRWIQRQINDQFTKKSKELNFKSRASFKLIEINQQFKIFKNVKNILDLGYAPGSWSQVCKMEMDKKGINYKILGIDLIQCSPPNGVDFIQGDFLNMETHTKILNYFNSTEKVTTINGDQDHHDKTDNTNNGVDLIVSDMLMNTTGISNIDHLSSVDLCESVISLSNILLNKNGNLVMKFYSGSEQKMIEDKLHTYFKKQFKFKPKSSRSESKEMFFIGLKKR